jgi:hypothetical protein
VRCRADRDLPIFAKCLPTTCAVIFAAFPVQPLKRRETRTLRRDLRTRKNAFFLVQSPLAAVPHLRLIRDKVSTPRVSQVSQSRHQELNVFRHSRTNIETQFLSASLRKNEPSCLVLVSDFELAAKAALDTAKRAVANDEGHRPDDQTPGHQLPHVSPMSHFEDENPTFYGTFKRQSRHSLFALDE